MAKSEARYTIPHTISHIAHRVPSQKKTGRAFFSFLLLEPVVGVEPTTCCLRNYPSVQTGAIVASGDRIGMR